MEELPEYDTQLHPLGLLALGILGVATLVLPRRYAAVPMLMMACLIPARQRLVVASLDFTLLRLMVLFGWIRLFVRSELTSLRWRPLDYLVVAQSLMLVLAMGARTLSLSGVILPLGVAFDALGMYFLFRSLFRRWSDLESLAISIAMLAILAGLLFAVESQTGRNLFATFGGVPAFTLVREGQVRAQGAFSHPILAGSFWVSLLPLLAILWIRRPSLRPLAGAGMAGALATIFFCSSSTPVAGVAAVVAAACAFPFRRYTRVALWGGVGCLFLLHMVMDAPVWHLISRIDLAGGSTGWHRYQIIDSAIGHFGEWWLYGTDSVAHWGHLTTDITNHYVLLGVRGGFFTLLLFGLVIATGFRDVGRLRRGVRKSRRDELSAWALGCSLLAHSVMLLAVSYFGQVILSWYLSLGLIGALTSRRGQPLRRAGRSSPPRGFPPGGPHARARPRKSPPVADAMDFQSSRVAERRYDSDKRRAAEDAK